MKKFLLCNAVALLLFVFAITWLSITRVNEFRAYHTVIAKDSASTTAEAIADYLNEQKRLVHIFGKENTTLISKIIQDPDNEALQQQLEHRVELYFPDHFAVTLADPEGELLIDHFSGLIEEICLSDLQEFARTQFQFQRIHPNPKGYHFDVLTMLSVPRDIILYISFHADVLARLLKHAHVPGHDLMIVLAEEAWLIEATEQGPRTALDREDYHLTGEEKDRILAHKKVPGSSWSVVALYSEHLFTDFRNRILLENSIIIAIFVLFAIVAMQIYLSERKKSHSKNKEEG